ncbi:MAG: 50S ribosomal protein L19 [Verrucomicrobiota bacterium]|nr:50S ribosomal protein L19 [Verrucomicrobiota bacterium]
MSRLKVIEEVESSYLKKKVPVFNVGDTVRVQTRVIEGDKERNQAFLGTVVAKKGTGLSETFTVYRTAYGSSMERVFLVHSPRISEIEVVRSGKVRRAKLYYLRGKAGKGAKLREQFNAGQEAQAAPVEAVPEQTTEA